RPEARIGGARSLGSAPDDPAEHRSVLGRGRRCGRRAPRRLARRTLAARANSARARARASRAQEPGAPRAGARARARARDRAVVGRVRAAREPAVPEPFGSVLAARAREPDRAYRADEG